MTDLAAVHEGFGIFLANSALTFGQWTDAQLHGWQSSTPGYLNDSALAFALAIFCHRKAADAAQAAVNPKPNPREIFCDALGYVAELDATT